MEQGMVECNTNSVTSPTFPHKISNRFFSVEAELSFGDSELTYNAILQQN